MPTALTVLEVTLPLSFPCLQTARISKQGCVSAQGITPGLGTESVSVLTAGWLSHAQSGFSGNIWSQLRPASGQGLSSCQGRPAQKVT
ncbi:unnamed protein product [Gulo gulo]|uniref:Uncharacterized protein n=1 Tax=Gulo gulo TaxID=48420 RepID=A0A9X9PYP9_GULGU|nr:unnamed protein product [Gulo gulo]